MRIPARTGGRWTLALATMVASIALCAHNHHPDLPRPLSLTLTLAPSTGGMRQPLLVTGRTGLADFLHVRQQNPDSIVFGYDSWGTPGVSSAPVPAVLGRPAALQIEMPGVWMLDGMGDGPQRLRVVYDGTVVLDQDVAFHPRSRAALYFAVNPHHGSGIGSKLDGQLSRADGRRLQGSVSNAFSLGERVLAWLKVARWQGLSVLLLGACAALWGARLGGFARRRLRRLRLALRGWRGHMVFMTTATVCTVAFALLLVHGSPTSIHPVSLRTVYDFQAASLLDGRLDVPREAVHGEAFDVKGKYTTYFGIAPALLRLPFVFFDVRFGALTDAFMIAEYLGCLIFAYLILCQAWRLLVPRAPSPRPFAVIVLLVNLGLGSTLFFLGSRSFVYHEALASGLCFTLGAAYYSLRTLAAPERRCWIGALVCGTLAVHCRPPLGLFALCLVGVTAVAGIVRPLLQSDAGRPWSARLPRAWPRHLAVGLLALLGILSFNGLSYLKFGTFDGSPLRYNEQYDQARLARIEGRSFHWSNLPLNSSAYLLRPGWGLTAHFPYLTTSAHEPGPHSKAKIDQAEPMLGLPFAVPGLFWLGLGGLLGTLGWRRRLRPVVWVLITAALPMSLAMFAAVATSQRYTTDFLPFLVCAAALGTALLDGARPALRTLGRALTALVTVAAILITLALTLRYQGEQLWDVPQHVAEDYRSLGKAVDALLRIRPPSADETTPTP